MISLNEPRWRAFGFIAFAMLHPSAARAASGPEVVPGQFVVGFRAPAALQAASLEASRGVAQVMGNQPRLGAVRMRLLPGVTLTAARERLARRGDVAYVEPLYVRRAAASPNDSSYGSQWSLPKIEADRSWDVWQPQSQVKIAIVDTGIDQSHPDLANLLVRDGTGAVVNYNAQTNSSAPGAANDDNGHGTHCAGIAAGQINNGRGIAGVAGWNPSVPNSNTYIKLLPVKVLDSSGSGTDADVAEGILWAADQGAKVISLSLGGEGASTTLTNATNYARSKGCVVVGAAGNDGVSTKFYPAANTGVISVGATDSSDVLASFSNWGTWVKVAAPGVAIYATYPGNRYVAMSGTSMAAPHVAGEAAAIVAQNPNLSINEVENLIVDNIDPYQGYSGRLLASGAGRINVRRALEAAGGAPVGISTVTLAPSTVTGATSSTGTVTLTGTAPTGGTAVSLVSDSSVASVPANIQVLAGQLSASFQVTTNPVSLNNAVTISATVGSDVKTATLQVRPPAANTLTLSPTAVNAGQSTTATIQLNGPAPAGGTSVALASGNGIATVPAAVLVNAGANSATFNVGTTTVPVDTAVTITATAGGVTRSASLTVRKVVAVATLSSVSVGVSSVTGGTTVSGMVTLDQAAPTGGIPVTLSATGPLSVPGGVTVPAGANTAVFTIGTSVVGSSVSAGVQATYNGVTRTATFTVEPPTAAFQFTLTPASIRGGKSSTGIITLAASAPVGGVTFALSSSNAAASVPTSIRIRAGSRQVSFAVKTTSVTSSRTAQVTATLGSSSASSQLTINPPSVKRLSLVSTRVRGGKATVANVLLDGPAPAEGLALLVSTDQGAVKVPQSVQVPAGKTKVKFTVQTVSVSAIVVAGISVSVAGAPGSTQLTILPARAAQRGPTAHSLRQTISRRTR